MFFNSNFEKTETDIIHRDLKTDNVLVASLDHQAPVCGKLSDFNTSRFGGSDALQSKTKGVGTPAFMSPEGLAGEKYDSRSDVFSFSILVWNVFTQKEPYSEFSNHYS